MAILPFCQTPFGSSHLSVHVSLFYKQKKELVVPLFNYCGAPGEIRTPDRLVRSQVLYPAELRARKFAVFTIWSPVRHRIVSSIMAEKEGFEPSMRLQTPYSLSRGAPSTTRPSLRTEEAAV